MSAPRFVPLVVLLLMAALIPAAVRAQVPGDIPRLTGPVTDLADSADVTAPTDGSLERLQREENFQLFSLFVDTTGQQSIAEFTEDVVRLNGLGAADALFVVAVEDRTYQLWLGDTIAEDVSENEQDALLAGAVETDLREGRYSDAVSAMATGLQSAVNASGSTFGGFSLWWRADPAAGPRRRAAVPVVRREGSWPPGRGRPRPAAAAAKVHQGAGKRCEQPPVAARRRCARGGTGARL